MMPRKKVGKTREHRHSTNFAEFARNRILTACDVCGKVILRSNKGTRRWNEGVKEKKK